jgi:alcohol dehydrogenase class IV
VLFGGATAEDGSERVEELCRDLGIPKLRTYGITEGEIPTIAAKAAQASSMKANPIQLTAAELHTTLAAAL